MSGSLKRVCSVCVMDESNPAIAFDESGQCNCCRDAQRRMPHEWWPNSEGEARMQTLVSMLKEQGRGKPYDVMVGSEFQPPSTCTASRRRPYFRLATCAR